MLGVTLSASTAIVKSATIAQCSTMKAYTDNRFIPSSFVRISVGSKTPLFH